VTRRGRVALWVALVLVCVVVWSLAVVGALNLFTGR
jgi:hypothetical protein